MHTFLIWEREKQRNFWKLSKCRSICQHSENAGIVSLPLLFSAPPFSHCFLHSVVVHAQKRNLTLRLCLGICWSDTAREDRKKQAWQNFPVFLQLPTKIHDSSNVFADEDYGKNFGWLIFEISNYQSIWKINWPIHFREWDTLLLPRKMKSLFTEKYRTTRHGAKRLKEVNRKKNVLRSLN